MKPIYEKITPGWNESFYCEVIKADSYGTPWHFHPEYELVLVLKSRGHRMVGDHIARLTPGDLVFVGSNLPHVWYQDNCKRSRRDPVQAVVIQFHPDLIHTGLGRYPELAHVRRFLSRASRGFQINGSARETVSLKMQEIATGRGFPRLIALLQILECLTNTKELAPLASARYAPDLNASDQSRIGRVCEHINAHLTESLDRDSLSNIACLSPNAFSRFFKARTGRSAPALINELRIGRACLLLEDEKTSITEVALSCGFNSLANFQRQFIRRMHTTPSNYRAVALAGSANS